MASTTPLALLDALAPYSPRLADRELAFDPDPPDDLADELGQLGTGVRAILLGRPWLGCGSTPKTARYVELNPSLPIPDGVTLLAVAGDAKWVRVRPISAAAA